MPPAARPPRSHVVLLSFLVVLGLQAHFWLSTKDIRPDLGIVPEVPGRTTIHALSFGDDQAYFRSLGLLLQNAGDTFGRFTALYKYDYKKLYHWFLLLDELDGTSQYVPTMATYYYGQTQNVPDVRYVVDYLYAHSAPDPATNRKWWWLVQAAYLANHRLEDKDLAIKVTQPMVHAEGVPVWARQMAAYIYEQHGEFEDALNIMETVKDNAKELSPEDLRFMRYFIEERLSALGEKRYQHDWGFKP